MTEKITGIIREKRETYWGDRINSQLKFGAMLSERNNGRFDSVLESAEEFVAKFCGEDNSISKECVLEAEKILEPIRAYAKEYRIICTSHAHIDMNWQWGWDETVSVAIDTVTTMLKIMEEYPDFKFSLSQASTYKIIYDYAPELFEKIKARVHEGRWEVTAPSWVECDKNMPNGESLAKQIYYAKEFLSKSLEIEKDSINVDFEPDTFGHSINVPEILANSGVKYYYHCRGTNEPYSVYRWQSPSGKEIIVNRERNFYSSAVTTLWGPVAIETADITGFKTSLRVYGVGDHGGGPSRRDIERLHDMDSWPCSPNFTLGTYNEFFLEMEKFKNLLPIVKGEINFVCDGCYSSQSKIKGGNRACENELYVSEAITAALELSGVPVNHEAYKKAWHNVLLGHFHDIVTGSGVEATRHHAIGMQQETKALSESERKLAIKKITDNISTLELLPVPKVNVRAAVDGPWAEGAGVGSGQAEQGLGTRRVYHIFNSLCFENTQVVELMLWDWNWDTERIIVTDTNGNPILHQVVDKGFNGYWGHHYTRILVYATTPPLGYTTIIVDEGEATHKGTYWLEKKQQWQEQFILENDALKIEINSLDASILSVFDKEENTAIHTKGGGIFRYILEANRKELSQWDKEMSSWFVGRYKSVEDIGRDAEISLSSGILRDTVTLELVYKNSKIKYSLYLDKGSRILNCKADIDWLEIGDENKGTPQLSFFMPLSFNTNEYIFDVPFGIIKRDGIGYDLPATSFAAAESEGSMVVLFGNNQYGYRCVNNSISATLLRSSFEPDRFPECGEQKKELGIYFGKPLTATELVKLSQCQNIAPVVTTNSRHNGTLPSENQYLSIDGDICVSAVNSTENGMLVRVYEVDGMEKTVRFNLAGSVKALWISDTNQNLLEKISGSEIKVNANSVVTVIIK